MVLVDVAAPAATCGSRTRCTARCVRSALPVLRARGLRLRVAADDPGARAALARRRAARRPAAARRGRRDPAGAARRRGARREPRRRPGARRRSSPSGRVADGARPAGGAGAGARAHRAQALRGRRRRCSPRGRRRVAGPRPARRRSTTWSSASHALFWGLGRAAETRARCSTRARLVGRSARGSAGCCRCASRYAACRRVQRERSTSLRGAARRSGRSTPRRAAWPSGGYASRCSTSGGPARPIALRAGACGRRVPLRDYSDALALGIWRMIAFESGQDWPALEAYMGETLREAVARATTTRRRATRRSASATSASSPAATRDAAPLVRGGRAALRAQDTFGTLIHVRALRVGVDYFAGRRPGRRSRRSSACRRARRPRAAARPSAPYVVRAEGWAARARGATRRRGACCSPRRRTLARDMPGYAAQLIYEALRAGAPAGDVAAELAAAGGALRRAARRRRTRRTRRRWRRATARRCSRSPRSWPRSARCATGSRPPRTPRRRSSRAGRAGLRAARGGPRAGAARARPGHRAAGDRRARRPRRSTLTSREAQLVELARRGLSNAEIADQLVLSVRTVETHLYRAMHKLGVSDRREL